MSTFGGVFLLLKVGDRRFRELKWKFIIHRLGKRERKEGGGVIYQPPFRSHAHLHLHAELRRSEVDVKG